MDYFCADTPPPEINFGQEGNDNPGSEQFETVSDEDYFEACLASADLRELGLPHVSAAIGWRACRAANHLFDEFRNARSAADLGGPEAAARFKVASSRLLHVTRGALTGFPGWKEAMEEQE
jgi:hypothetical protein